MRFFVGFERDGVGMSRLFNATIVAPSDQHTETACSWRGSGTWRLMQQLIHEYIGADPLQSGTEG